MSNSEGNNPLGDIVGNILGGGTNQNQPPAQPSRPASPPPADNAPDNPLGDILGQVLGGSTSSSSAPAGGGDPLGGILGSILGGGSTSSGGAPAGGNDPLGGILGSILGGGSTSSSGGPTSGGDPLGGILGSILGGGLGGGSILGAGAGAMAAPILEPIADTLSQKLGISKTIAMAIVTFAATKIIGSFLNKQGQPTSQLVDAQLVDKVKAGDATPQYFADTGMLDEVVQQTGLDRETAAQGLQTAFALVDQQFAQ